MQISELPDGTVQLTLSAEVKSAQSARHFVHERWGDLNDDALADVELIATELVGNAVRHGEPEIIFRLRVEPFAIDIAVLDHGSTLPPASPTPAALDATSGRGLMIIDQLASSWGVEPLDGRVGKTVWATVRTS